MGIDDILATVGGAGAVEIPPGWGQGRATFGGLVAALMYQRFQGLVPADRTLRSVTVSFVGPVAPGALELQALVIRSGKSVTQAECRASQNGEVVAVMLASFGGNRSSGIEVGASLAPVFAGPEAGMALPYIPNVVPEFTQQLDFRWSRGGLPFTSASESAIGGWVRFKQGAALAGTAHVLALVDAWPPAVLPMYKAPAPASSLCWTMELMAEPQARQGTDWWQYLAETDFAANGYAHIQAKLWNDSGELVAISRQTVTVFA